jgi:hypothetical protein
MEHYSQWFDKVLNLSELIVQCPFADRFKSEYLNCFHNVYILQEFDWRRYINDHPELKHINRRDELTAYNEWANRGRLGAFVCESNKPYNGFPWTSYLKLNPDLIGNSILSELQAVHHWINHGRAEKRTVVQEMSLISETVRDEFIAKKGSNSLVECNLVKEFDWEKYLIHNPDVVKAGITCEQHAYAHWSLYGRREGRIAYILGSAEHYKDGFHWKAYLEKNPQLKHVRGEIPCYNHWVEYGRKSGYKVWDVEYIDVPIVSIFKEDFTNIDNILLCRNKIILIVIETNLNFTAGDTIMCSNWMNVLMKNNNHIRLFSTYPIGSIFTRNLMYNNYTYKTFHTNAALVQEIDQCTPNMDILFIRNSQILDRIAPKEYLHKTYLYGLDPHMNGIAKMNNKFHTIITQSEQLKAKYIEAGVYMDKITVVEPLLYKYEFQLPERKDSEIRLIYCGTLRNEENIVELIEEFQKIHAKRPEVMLNIVYGKIHGDYNFTQTVNAYIQSGVDGISFKQNLTHRDSCYEIATSDIGICWRKTGWGDNGEISTKRKEYALYEKRVCNISPMLFNL